jgi:hypothetical protein
LKFLSKPLRDLAELHLRNTLLKVLDKEKGPEPVVVSIPTQASKKKVWTADMDGLEAMMAGESDSEEESEEATNGAAIISRGLQIMRELDYYKKLQQISIHSTGDQVFEWWRNLDKCKQVPLLSQMARKYLAIQATSGTSERVFSTGGNTVTAKRYSLGDELASKLVAAHGAIDVVTKVNPETKKRDVIRTVAASKVGVKGPQPRRSADIVEISS